MNFMPRSQVKILRFSPHDRLGVPSADVDVVEMTATLPLARIEPWPVILTTDLSWDDTVVRIKDYIPSTDSFP